MRENVAETVQSEKLRAAPVEGIQHNAHVNWIDILLPAERNSRILFSSALPGSRKALFVAPSPVLQNPFGQGLNFRIVQQVLVALLFLATWSSTLRARVALGPWSAGNLLAYLYLNIQTYIELFWHTKRRLYMLMR